MLLTAIKETDRKGEECLLFRFCLCLESNKKVKGDSFRLSRWGVGGSITISGSNFECTLGRLCFERRGRETNPPKLRPKFGYRLLLYIQIRFCCYSSLSPFSAFLFCAN